MALTSTDHPYISWPSPAKLNLFLHITGKRNDGYHNLQSLFQMLDIGDTIHIRIRDDDRIHLLTDIEGVHHDDNLIVRAAKRLQSETGCKFGCDIKLKKQLPMGGGIGGGSSNAATTLVALNAMWKTQLSTEQLLHIGLQLGADVPVFINGKTAFASGVGEKLEAVDLPEKFYLVVNPGVHVSTAQMFAHADLPRDTSEICWHEYQFEKTHNDFQPLACQLFPVIANTLQWLLQYAPSRMTGTGACLFSIFEDRDSAERAKLELPVTLTGFVAKGCNTSPLLERLNRFQLNKTNATKHF